MPYKPTQIPTSYTFAPAEGQQSGKHFTTAKQALHAASYFAEVCAENNEIIKV